MLQTVASEARSFGAPVVAVSFAHGMTDAFRTTCESLGITSMQSAGFGSFGAAANVGARACDADVLVFINGAQPAEPGWLDALLTTSRLPRVGVVGPRVAIGDDTSEVCGLTVHSAPQTPRGFDFQILVSARVRIDCDAFLSDCFVTQRAVFDELGGFSEAFGSELESIDYCLRAAERGYRVVLEPRVSVTRSGNKEEEDETGVAAFNERWRDRVETHENYWPELTGSIMRVERLQDGVRTVPVRIPQVTVLLHGEKPTAAFVAQLSAGRMKPISAKWASPEAFVRTACEMTELRGPDYVAFVRTDSDLRGDWLNELVNAIERSPDSAVAVFAEPADGRCTLVVPYRFPQHLRIEVAESPDAAIAIWLRAIVDAGRTIARVRRTAVTLGPAAPDVYPALTVAAGASSAEPFVSIVMLSWNAPEYTELCIESIRARTGIPHEIIVVDNGSNSETIERLQRIADIRVIYNAVNTGFAYGCNQGLAAARGTHVVLLNNDVIVTEGWLEPLVSVLQRHPTVGCSAPRSNEVAGAQRLAVPYEDLADLPVFAARRAVEFRGRWSYQSRVIGLCLCLDRRVVAEIGGLDPLYGTGNFEDDDYCMRIRSAGYEIAMCEDSFIHHFGSVSFRVNQVDYNAIFARNMALFAQRWNVRFDGASYSLPPRRGFLRERDYVVLPPPVGVGPDWTAARG